MAGDNPSDQPVKQEKNKPKVGFHTNPERINRKGRPVKGQSLTDLMREFLEEAPEGEKVTYKEAFIRKVYQKAMRDGDLKAMRLIWNYVDGMPQQAVDVTSLGEKLENQVVVQLPSNGREKGN